MTSGAHCIRPHSVTSQPVDYANCSVRCWGHGTTQVRFKRVVAVSRSRVTLLHTRGTRTHTPTHVYACSVTPQDFTGADDLPQHHLEANYYSSRNDNLDTYRTFDGDLLVTMMCMFWGCVCEWVRT